MEKTKKRLLLAVCLSVGVLVSAVSQGGQTFSFEKITSNSVATDGVGESQFYVDVIDSGAGQVTFEFSNTGDELSSITAIYFDNGHRSSSTLQSIIDIDNSSDGVAFSKGSNPGKLPGRNLLDDPFVKTKTLSADADAPKQPNGVNPGEYVGLTLSLAQERSFDDVISELLSGQLRIGLHVQGFADGSSETYVNNGPIVPVPGSVLLAGIGMGLVRFLRFRKSEV